MSVPSNASNGKKPDAAKDAKSIRGKVKRAELKRFTPMQRRFIHLIPQVVSGKITVENAMRRAGYSPSTAKQQTKVMSQVRNNSVMQDALRKAGVTEEMLADKVKKGLGNQSDKIMGIFAKLAAELLDAFPAQKQDHTFRTPEEAMDDVEKDGETAAWEVPEEK